MASNTWDVMVVGGGPAGIAAAIQAARAGARTILVEKTARLGGTIVNGGVNAPGRFYAWGKPAIAGIGWEIVVRCVDEMGQLPVEAPERFWGAHVGVDMMLFAAICDEMVLGAGADLLFHTMPAAAAREGDVWRVSLCCKEGLVEHRAAVLIDATGDANLVALAGGPVRIHQPTQPNTLCCQFAGYDFESLDLDALDRAFIEAVKAGEVKAQDACWRIDAPTVRNILRSRGHNANHVRVDVPVHDSAGRSRLEVEGRRSVYRLWRWMRRQPGLEKVRLDWVSPEVGVRETVTIVGRETVTLQDYESGRVFDDAVCYAFYQVDWHGIDSKEWQAWPLKEGVLPTIPRGALLPRQTTNLIAAGRCLSSDRLANSALRVQVPCFAMGQAAGVMAALAARTGVPAHEQDVAEVRAMLRENGAIVPNVESRK